MPEKKDSKWIRVCRVVSQDFDKELKAYTGGSHVVELQQNTATKEVRTVRLED